MRGKLHTMPRRASSPRTIDPVQRQISSNIRKLLTDREMSREELSSRIGFTPLLLSQRLTGRSEWKPQELAPAAQALGVTVDALYHELRYVTAGSNFLHAVDSDPSKRVAAGGSDVQGALTDRLTHSDLVPASEETSFLYRDAAAA